MTMSKNRNPAHPHPLTLSHLSQCQENDLRKQRTIDQARRGIMKRPHDDRLKEESSAPSFLTPVIWCILVTETGERFAYFGFRAVLVLYFTKALEYDENQAIAYFAYTTSLAYLSPLVGSLIADGGLGRYKTILYFGILYVIGLAILTLAALPSFFDLSVKRFVSFLGLLLVCIGTGGIKPCVSAFGADQVAAQTTKNTTHYSGDDEDDSSDNQKTPAFSSEDPSSSSYCDDPLNTTEESRGDQGTILCADPLDHEQSGLAENRGELVRRFFAYFYFCINVGALTSIAIVPILRSRYGFYAAFLLPTCFMVTAMLLFLSKRNEYVHHVPGKDGSSLGTTCHLVLWLLRHQLASNPTLSRMLPFLRPSAPPLCYQPRHHVHELLPATESEHEPSSASKDDDLSGRPESANDVSILKQQLDDAAQALHVLPIMAMLPIFWCLYDQQGSVWTLQATRMDLKFFRWELQPEQLTVINPLEIMIFIPLFDQVIYPAMQARRWDIRPLRRMSWGMILTAASFFLSGLVDSAIESAFAKQEEKVSVFWQLPQITILAVGEIFISVTGLEFAYSTSPERLKAFLMGIFLLTTAVGDLFSGVLYSTVFADMHRATVMHICALLMLCNLALFYRVSRWYERTNFQALQVIPSQEGVEFQEL
jgi:dipeptide/tripeptide permease